LVSALGDTVQALAVHILEAEEQATNNSGAFLAASDNILASVPANPNLRKVLISGLSIGAKTACGNPRSCNAFILDRPCNAASLGFAAPMAFFNEATLPTDNPA